MYDLNPQPKIERLSTNYLQIDKQQCLLVKNTTRCSSSSAMVKASAFLSALNRKAFYRST